jgi:hypothetical protein
MALVTPLKLVAAGAFSVFQAGDYVTPSALGSGTADSTTVLRGNQTWATISTILGYTPWHAGNDGSGSGLDADLLDGQHGSYYAPVANPTFTGTVTVGNSASSTIVMVDTDEGNRSIHCNSNRIGFLNSSGNWGAYCDDSGNWGVAGNVSASGYLSGSYVSALGAESSFYQISITKPNGEAFIYFKNDASRYLHSNPIGFQFSHHTYAPTLGSTVATGTAPLSIASTTVCTNLNADLLDGYHGSQSATANTAAIRDASGHLNVVSLAASGVVQPGNLANWYLGLSSGYPLINFDANDYVLYDRTNNIETHYIGSAIAMQIRQNATTFRGNSGGMTQRNATVAASGGVVSFNVGLTALVLLRDNTTGGGAVVWYAAYNAPIIVTQSGGSAYSVTTGANQWWVDNSPSGTLRLVNQYGASHNIAVFILSPQSDNGVTFNGS